MKPDSSLRSPPCPPPVARNATGKLGFSLHEGHHVSARSDRSDRTGRNSRDNRNNRDNRLPASSGQDPVPDSARPHTTTMPTPGPPSVPVLTQRLPNSSAADMVDSTAVRSSQRDQQILRNQRSVLLLRAQMEMQTLDHMFAGFLDANPVLGQECKPFVEISAQVQNIRGLMSSILAAQDSNQDGAERAILLDLRRCLAGLEKLGEMLADASDGKADLLASKRVENEAMLLAYLDWLGKVHADWKTNMANLADVTQVLFQRRYAPEPQPCGPQQTPTAKRSPATGSDPDLLHRPGSSTAVAEQKRDPALLHGHRYHGLVSNLQSEVPELVDVGGAAITAAGKRRGKAPSQLSRRAARQDLSPRSETGAVHASMPGNADASVSANAADCNPAIAVQNHACPGQSSAPVATERTRRRGSELMGRQRSAALTTVGQMVTRLGNLPLPAWALALEKSGRKARKLYACDRGSPARLELAREVALVAGIIGASAVSASELSRDNGSPEAGAALQSALRKASAWLEEVMALLGKRDIDSLQRMYIRLRGARHEVSQARVARAKLAAGSRDVLSALPGDLDSPTNLVHWIGICLDDALDGLTAVMKKADDFIDEVVATQYLPAQMPGGSLQSLFDTGSD